eukprot:gene7567-11593_t
MEGLDSQQYQTSDPGEPEGVRLEDMGGDEDVEPPGKAIVAKVSELYPDKVSQVIQKLLDEMQAGGLSWESAREELVYCLLHQPPFVYLIWRLILTDEAYQMTTEELEQAAAANDLLDWLRTFGSGIIDEQSCDVLLCTYHPNKYQELLDYLMEQYQNDVPEMEFFYLKNKVQKMKSDESRDVSDGFEGDDYENSHKAQKMDLTLMPVGKTEANLMRTPRLLQVRKRTGRTRWLHENAKIARKYHAQFHGNAFAAFARAIGVSPGFRVYVSIWIAAVIVLSVLFGFNGLFMLLTRTFIPVDYEYLTVVAMFSCFVLAVTFLGSFLTTMERIAKGWVLMDDETFFADEDYATLYNDKTGASRRRRNDRRRQRSDVPGDGAAADDDYDDDAPEPLSNPANETGCPHLLPPYTSRTFLLLPSGRRWLRRETWLGVLVLATVVVPLFYAVIRTAVEGDAVYAAVGFFVEWNIAAFCALCALYFVYMWYFAMRKKYAAWKRNKQGDVSKAVDIEFLQEFGLDERSVRRNLIVVVGSAVPLVITFWIVSYEDIHVTADWIISAAVVAILLLCLRECCRTDSWRDKIPAIVLALVAVFFVVGLISSISAGGAMVTLFVFLAIATQMMLLRHRPVANPDEVFWLFEFLKTVDQRLRREALDGAYQPKTPKTPGALQRDVRKKLSKTLQRERARARDSDPNREDSWIPCLSILGAAFDFPCLSRSCTRESPEDAVPASPSVVDDIDRGFWRLNERYWGEHATLPTSEAKARGEPTEKLVQTLSPRIGGWFMVCFLVVCILVFALSQELREPDTIDTITVSATPPTDPLNSYPVCRMKKSLLPTFELSIIDAAFLAKIAYAPEATARQAVEQALALEAGKWSLLPVGQANGVNNGNNGQPLFYHFYSNVTAESVIVVRSPFEWEFLLRDVDIWGESVLLQVFSYVFPPARFFTRQQEKDFVKGLHAFKSVVDQSDVQEVDRLSPLTRYFYSWAKAPLRDAHGQAVPFSEAILLAGHGTNGGLARIVASRFSLPVVTFNAPGTSWVESRFSMGTNIAQEVNVASPTGLLYNVDRQTGMQQII